MKKNIKLSGIDPLIFAGADDANIKYIENNFDSNIVLRGDKIILEGKSDEIKQLELLINDMIFTINKKGFIDDSDLDILNQSSKSFSDFSKEDFVSKDIILYTHLGAVVAKTAGQKKYHSA